MRFFSSKMKVKWTTTRKQEGPVIVRVEPPGYSAHEFPPMQASQLRSPHFAQLMAMAKEELGVDGKVVVVIPCQLDDFLIALVKTVARAPSRPWACGPAAPPKRRSLGCFLGCP